MNLTENIISNFESKIDSFSGQYVQDLKKSALEVFKTKGFPTIKNEDWKYTSLKSIIKIDYKLDTDINSVSKELVEQYATKVDSLKVVLVNGIFNEELSDVVSNDELEIASLKDKLNNSPEQVETFLGKIAPSDNEMVALNNLSFNDGLFLKVKKNKIVEKTIQLLSFVTEEESFSRNRNLIVAEANSQVKIIEKQISLNDSKTFANNLTEISVGENSNYYHYRIQNDNDSASLVDNTYVDQKRYSNTYIDTFSFGGNITRNNLSIALSEENAVANFNGITLLTKNEQVDNHTYVDHLVPNCDSHELFKGIYDGSSKGVFRGKIFIHKDAQNTNGNQQNSNLVLSEKAQINAKPQLEIYADDVKASHGCTIGQLDEEALFFLRSRGIPLKEAKALMMFAFASEALENVKIEELKEEINKIIAAKLEVDLEFSE